MTRTRLTEAIVIEARRRARQGEGYASIAESLGVGKKAIAAAVRGDHWSRLDSIEAPLRRARGLAHTVLTAEIVISARQRVKRGEFVTHLAREYGVSFQLLGQAVRGRTWKHLDQREAPAESAGRGWRRGVYGPTVAGELRAARP